MPKKVMVIGWDSSDFTLIKPWAEEGYLPNLADLMRISKYGSLTSVYPPVTPMAWSNIVTGKNAGKHGLNGFMNFRSNSYDVEPVSAVNRQGNDIWELLSESGKKVAVVGVPLTFPVRKVNGCMISGFLTPYGTDEYCFPKNLRDEITSKVPGYTPSRPNHLAGEFNTASDEVFVKSLFDILEKHIDGMIYIAENKEWDFFMGVFNETDWVQHKFWATIDKSHPKYEEKRAKKFGNVIRDVHIRLDQALGDLLKIAGDANILVISDHGAAPLFWNVNVNYFLYKMHILRFNRSLKSRTRVFAARMGFSPQLMFALIRKMYGRPKYVNHKEFKNDSKNKKSGKHNNDTKNPPFVKLSRAVYKAFLLTTSDVDWPNTIAYAPPGGNGAIFMNVKGRFPYGTVDESKYPQLREDLIKEIKQLRFNNSDFIEEVFTREQLFNGEYSNQQPDIQLHFAEGYFGIGGFTLDLLHPFVRAHTLYGIHSMNGIIILKETGYEPSSRTIYDAQLVDIVPTILHIMDVPMPSDLDGKSLADRKEKPKIMEGLAPNLSRLDTPLGYTKEEEEDIEDRLRSLGYI